MADRNRPRKESSRRDARREQAGASPPHGGTSPPHGANAEQDAGKADPNGNAGRSFWQRATSFFTSVRGIVSTIGAIVVAVASILRFFAGNFDERLLAERTRLFASNSSIEDRLDAVRVLSGMPGNRSEYERIAAILETALTVRAASADGGAPCDSASGSDPLVVQRTLLALASVHARSGQRLALDLADLRGLSGDSIVLDGARITRSCLKDARLNGASLRSADLSESDLTDADLEGAHLDSARLRYVDFTNVNLNNARLTDADLLGARLLRVSAVNADFRFADMTNARLDSMDVTFACLAGASLAGADLRGLRYWEELRSLNQAYVGHVANAPDGLVRRARQDGGIVTSLGADSLAAHRVRARAQLASGDGCATG